MPTRRSSAPPPRAPKTPLQTVSIPPKWVISPDKTGQFDLRLTLRYLTKFKILPEDIDAKKDLEAIIKVEEWEPKPQPKGKKK